MNPQQPPITCDNKSSTPSKILDALEQAIDRQMKFTAQRNMAATQGVVEQIGRLISQLQAVGPIPPECRPRLVQFQRRHNLAKLAMLQKRQELDLQIHKVRNGKKLLAYRQHKW
jgi:hypothetical protein